MKQAQVGCACLRHSRCASQRRCRASSEGSSCRSSPVTSSADSTTTVVCRSSRPIAWYLSGRAFRIFLGPGDLVEEIAPRLVETAVPSLPPDLPCITFSLVNGEDRVFVFRDGVCIAAEEKTSGARAILLQEMAGLCDPDR